MYVNDFTHTLNFMHVCKLSVNLFIVYLHARVNNEHACKYSLTYILKCIFPFGDILQFAQYCVN